jgi:phosphoglycolate phosphatase
VTAASGGGVNPDRLLLFDIDGTLITSGGAGEQALRDAMRERFGVEDDLANTALAGKTDALIAHELLAKNGLDVTPENASGLLDAYVTALGRNLPLHKGCLLPGMIELLDRLRNEPRCVLGLLTGNLARGAELKLTHYGVWHYFEFGAFADDHHDRNHLGPFAMDRARSSTGCAIPPQNTYVIGDTPRDIECGRAFGARTVAIATGGHTREELAAHNPDFLFDDFSDTEAVLRALVGDFPG